MKRGVIIGLGVGVCAAIAAVVVLAQPPRERNLRVSWSAEKKISEGVTVREGKLDGKPTWRALDVAVVTSKVELRVVEKQGGGRLSELVPAGALAAVNGGYFDESFRPTGWLVDEGRDLAPKKARTQGGVLAVHKDGVFIGPTAELTFAPELAIQNGPRLIETDGSIGIRSDDHQRAARTVACAAQGTLHLMTLFAPKGDGPTLFELAHFLAADPALGGMGCQAALNLDGGPSTGIWLPQNAGIVGQDTLAPIAYAIAVLPR